MKTITTKGKTINTLIMFIVAILILAVSSNLNAQSCDYEISQDFKLSTSNNITQFNTSYAVEDFDNDQDFDILINGGYYEYGVNKTYRFTQLLVNDGNGNFSKSANYNEKSVTMTGVVFYGAGSIETGDFDSDGDMDILVCGSRLSTSSTNFNYPGLYIYRNDGDMKFSLYASFYTSTQTSIGIGKFGDIDNDGDLDIVYVSSYGVYLTAILDNVNGVFTERATNLPQITNASYLQLKDYNSDGYLDVYMKGTLNDNTSTDNIYHNILSFQFSKTTKKGEIPNIITGNYDDDSSTDKLYKEIDLNDNGSPDIIGLSNYSWSTRKNYLTIFNNPNPYITFEGDNSICTGDTATITVTGGDTYFWNNGKNTSTIQVNPAQTTNYIVTAYLGSCTSSSQTSVTVNKLPSIKITGDTALCAGSTSSLIASGGISYLWNTTETLDQIDIHPTINSVYTVTGTNENNCKNIDSILISIKENPDVLTTPTGDASVCGSSNSTYLTSSPTNVDAYIWKLIPEQSGIIQGNNPVDIHWGTEYSGVAFLSVMGVNQCDTSEESYQTIVNIKPLPGDIDSILGQNSVCQGIDSIQFSTIVVPNATSYFWTLPNGFTGSSSTNVIYSDISTDAVNGTITVFAQNSCGTGGEYSKSITVNSRPNTPTVFQIENVLYSNSPTSNQWFNEVGLIATETSNSYEPSASGKYYVVVTKNGCDSDPSEVIDLILTGIKEFNSELLSIFPNPINDNLTIKSKFSSIKAVIIMNVLGEIVFKKYNSTSINTEIINLSKLPEGLYFVKLESEDNTIIKTIVKQ